MRPCSPPTFLCLLLESVLPDPYREAIIGDLIEQYTQTRGVRLVQVVAGERMVESRSIQRDHPPAVRALFQSGADRFSMMFGFDD